MTGNSKTQELLINHYNNYPDLQIQDIFKFLYQSSFGCEHAVPHSDNIISNIKEEYLSKAPESKSVLEQLDGGYCRVPLSFMNNGLCAETLGKLFFLSSKKEADGLTLLKKKLNTAKELISKKLLPFDITEFENELKYWESEGFPAVHHSDAFRETYNPSYRVIANEFIPFLHLFAEIDKRLQKGSLKIAIEGGSASGKSTLAEILTKVYACTVFHTDDFFLRPEQRTRERLSEIGGNLDRERFIEEVLLPLKENKTVYYRKLDCSTMTIQDATPIIPKKLIITEGAYSMHPKMEDYYDFSVFLDVIPELQKERISKRNSPDFAQRFFNEWIPLENKYFKATNIKKRCTLCISITD